MSLNNNFHYYWCSPMRVYNLAFMFESLEDTSLTVCGSLSLHDIRAVLNTTNAIIID